MLHGKNIPFHKNEDDHTRDGWTRVDHALPGWGHKVRVLGVCELEESAEGTHEDSALVINTGNSFMFWTTEWIPEHFTVTHWRTF